MGSLWVHAHKAIIQWASCQVKGYIVLNLMYHPYSQFYLCGLYNCLIWSSAKIQRPILGFRFESSLMLTDGNADVCAHKVDIGEGHASHTNLIICSWQKCAKGATEGDSSIATRCTDSHSNHILFTNIALNELVRSLFLQHTTGKPITQHPGGVSEAPAAGCLATRKNTYCIMLSSMAPTHIYVVSGLNSR